MLILFHILQIVFLVICGIAIIYQFLLSLAASLPNFKEVPPSSEKKKFALIILASGKEGGIFQTIYSLSALTYSKSRYDIFVVSDTPTDETSRIAMDLGIKVIIGNKILPEKISRILQRDSSYDAVIFFHSHSLVSADYLKIMSGYLQSGTEVILGSTFLMPTSKNWKEMLLQMHFIFSTYISLLGKRRLGLNIYRLANGVCISSQMLKKYPLFHSPLNDFKIYALQLLRNDVAIKFAPEASVWSQLPDKVIMESSLNSTSFGIVKKLYGSLIKRFFQKPSYKNGMLIVDLLTPSFSNVFLLTVTITSITVGLWMIGIYPGIYVFLWGVLVLMALISIATGLFIVKAEKRIYKYFSFKTKENVPQVENISGKKPKKEHLHQRDPDRVP